MSALRSSLLTPADSNTSFKYFLLFQGFVTEFVSLNREKTYNLWIVFTEG